MTRRAIVLSAVGGLVAVGIGSGVAALSGWEGLFNSVGSGKGVIRGRILDADRNRPLPGVAVIAFVHGGHVGEAVGRTDQRGSFEGRVKTGDWDLRFEAPETQRAYSLLPPVRRGWPQVFVDPGQAYDLGDLHLVLFEEMTVRGKVLAPDRRPAAGASVQCSQMSHDGRSCVWTRETVAVDGNFAFSGILRREGEGPLLLRARKATLATDCDMRVGMAGEPGPLTLQLAPRRPSTWHRRGRKQYRWTERRPTSANR